MLGETAQNKYSSGEAPWALGAMTMPSPARLQLTGSRTSAQTRARPLEELA